MILYDYEWKKNRDWWHRKPNGQPEINADAPEEAQQHYQYYLQQRAEVAEYLKKHPGFI